MEAKVHGAIDQAATNLKQLQVLLDGLKVLETSSTGWPGVAQALLDIRHAHGARTHQRGRAVHARRPRASPPLISFPAAAGTSRYSLTPLSLPHAQTR